MIERKETSSRKTTNCSQCERSFWYIDPRPGGRPRQKCGICSSRPPRYPWGFLDGEPNEFGHEPSFLSEAAHKPMPAHTNGLSQKRSRNLSHSHETPTRHVRTDDAAAEPYPMPSPYPAPLTRHSAGRSDAADEGALSRIEQKLDQLESRLTKLEQRLEQNNAGFVLRSDWVDVCARLDIVEQLTTETLGEVRSRLEHFSKEVKQIAVIPERELKEMFELVQTIRRHTIPDIEGNRFFERSGK